MMDLIQLKLSSGEEVVAEVMEYPSADMPEYIVRQAFSVRSMINDDGSMSHGLSPWMMLQEKSTDYILIQPTSIISIAKPSEFMLREYNAAIAYALINHKERVRRKKMVDEELLRQLESYTGSLESDSSSDNNIIYFPFINDPDPSIH